MHLSVSLHHCRHWQSILLSFYVESCTNQSSYQRLEVGLMTKTSSKIYSKITRKKEEKISANIGYVKDFRKYQKMIKFQLLFTFPKCTKLQLLQAKSNVFKMICSHLILVSINSVLFKTFYQFSVN